MQDDGRGVDLGCAGASNTLHASFEANFPVMGPERNDVVDFFIHHHVRKRSPDFLLVHSDLNIMQSDLKCGNALVSVVNGRGKLWSGVNSYGNATLKEDPEHLVVLKPLRIRGTP